MIPGGAELARRAVAAVGPDGRTPAVVVDLATVRHNIDVTLGIVGDPARWRAHAKTARVGAVMELLTAAGVRAFKASTIGEVEALLAAGAEDVLLALPAVGPLQWRMADLAERHPRARLSVLADDPAALATWRPGRVGAFVDLDTGMGRTGVPVRDRSAVRRLVEALAATDVPLRGLHSYDGHLAVMPPAARRAEVLESSRAILELGLPVREIVAGGSHTFADVCATWPGDPGPLTVGAGTVVLCDGRSLERFAVGGSPVGYRPAAAVVARVMSVAGERATVDAGLTVIQLDAGRPHVQVLSSEAGLEIAYPAQEHLVLRATGASRPRPGDLVALLPRHVDTTICQVSTVLALPESGKPATAERVVGRH